MSKFLKQNAVQVIEGHTVTTSRIVSEYFGKKHSDVVRAIDSIVANFPEGQASRNFAQWSEDVEIGSGAKRRVNGYVMDRKGFCLLAMGFTGKEALKFKIAFYDEFERMENELRNKTAVVTSNDGKLNEVERYEIQKAISKRAKDCSVHYQTIYHALYDRFRVASYKDLRRDQLSAALTFIEVVPLTPQIEAPKPEIPEGFYLVDRNTMLAMHSIVYLMWLNKPEFDQIGCAMRCLGSNITGRFRGFTLETQGPRKVVERALEKFGFDCRNPSGETLSIPL